MTEGSHSIIQRARAHRLFHVNPTREIKFPHPVQEKLEVSGSSAKEGDRDWQKHKAQREHHEVDGAYVVVGSDDTLHYAREMMEGQLKLCERRETQVGRASVWGHSQADDVPYLGSMTIG